ncbi:hypothetical protein KFL_000810225 [Klebsormidium nitens]|uniref:Uncharacterized protein n=1 Tax=Klebsormidium nitens TaxID=105231 RepID=A0A1Y1HWY5_KLENI|nr:hypothetical protein KFL_000810225 [Klebsormidium nitens]|eukprot:GAQ81481.1 hypothetical protein KFL_000810225 [Klebsormidium nitens]
MAASSSDVGDGGQLTSTMINDMKEKIGQELEAVSVVVQDISGDGRHVSIDVVSPVFEGKSSMNRQRMVYKAIWQELQGAVHAVDAMTTKTPTEAGVGQQPRQ